jgi:hypothetical protein
MALRPWSERTADVSGPKQVNIFDYVQDAPIGGNNTTVPLGKIYDTPGNTVMNTPLGALYELPGRYVWHQDPLDTSEKY